MNYVKRVPQKQRRKIKIEVQMMKSLLQKNEKTSMCFHRDTLGENVKHKTALGTGI